MITKACIGYANEDFPTEKENSRYIEHVMSATINNWYKANLNINKLIVNSKTYFVSLINTLDDLLQDLNPQLLSQRKDGAMLAYFGINHHSWISIKQGLNCKTDTSAVVNKVLNTIWLHYLEIRVECIISASNPSIMKKLGGQGKHCNNVDAKILQLNHAQQNLSRIKYYWKYYHRKTRGIGISPDDQWVLDWRTWS